MCIHCSCYCSIYQFTFETEKNVNGVVRGTLYKKCVYIVPVTGVSADLPLKRKKRLLLLKKERCILNVYRSFLLLKYLPLYL